MGHPVVFSLLWPKNHHVCVELARNHGYDIAVLPGALTAEHGAAIESTGRRCIVLDAAAFGVDAARAQSEGTARFSQLGTALPAHIGSIAGPELGARISAAMLKTVSGKIAGVMHFLDVLDALRARESVVGVLLNESDLPLGRAASLWCRANGVPGFVLSHGAGIGEAYTVTADAIADYMLFVGERGMEPYLDLGFPRDRMMVCGNPAWDSYPSVLANRMSIRERVYASIGLDSGIPLIVFGTTWNAKLTALRDAKIYEQTLAAFFHGCRVLSDTGACFHAVIKDRPPNAEFGKAETDRLAAQAGFSAYSYATGEMFTILTAADLFVGHDTSAFVEAMIAGVPSVDLWAPSCWLLGPALDLNDGIPMVQHSDAQGIARIMGALLNDPSERERALKCASDRMSHFVLACDGGSGARCAAAIASRLPAAPRTASAPTERALWALAAQEPREILDVGSKISPTAEKLLITYPAAGYRRIAVEGEGSATDAAQGADLVILDDQLERMYNPWEFLVELKRRLSSGAHVLARIPNARNLAFLADMVHGEWTYAQVTQRDPGRLRFFTRKSIQELFEQTGYRIVRIEPVYDTNVQAPQVPEDATFDLDAGSYALKGVTAKDVEELRTLEFLIDAAPI